MALCKKPIFIKAAKGLVPCGQCFTCRLNLRRKWTFRLLLEHLMHKDNRWITLTYAQEFLPLEYTDLKTGQIFYGHISDRPYSSATLNPRHIELFLMRLRKALFPRKFRYFLCGEYGDQNDRPHYHVCFFGLGSADVPLIKSCWTDPITGLPYGRAKDEGVLGPDSMQYTAGYTMKKMTSNKSDYQSEYLQNRYPEFMRGSKGLGRDAVPKLAKALASESGLDYISKVEDIPRSFSYNGKKWPIDRYIREKILDALHLTDPLKEAGQTRFAKEMRSLSLRAELNPEFSSAGVISPYVLEKQYTAENAQRVLNTETKAKLNMKGRTL